MPAMPPRVPPFVCRRELQAMMSLKHLKMPFKPPMRNTPSLNFSPSRFGSTLSAPSRPTRTWTRAPILLGVIATTGLAAVALSSPQEPLQASATTLQNEPSVFNPSDPLYALEPVQLMTSTAHLRETPFRTLVRQYLVYLGSSQSSLVNAGPAILQKLEGFRDHVPVAGDIAWSVFNLGMKATFFSVFVGGESVHDCQALVHALAEHNTGCLLNYSAEASGTDVNDAGVNKANMSESINAVRAATHLHASSLEPQASPMIKWSLKPTLFAVKLTGLVNDPQVLSRATSALVNSSSFQRGSELQAGVLFPESPDLTEEDHRVLAELYEGLRKMSHEAQLGGVRLLVDAEQSWYQGAVDRFVDLLSAEYNKVTPENSTSLPAIPIVYNTYQAYLRTTPESLKAAMDRADRGGYALGAKLVRGAYVDAERKRHSQSGAPGDCIVWNNKQETDSCYDECAALLENRVSREVKEGKAGVPGTGVVFASHNGPSMGKVLSLLREHGLARNVDGGLEVDNRVRGRISFAQLYGMSDNLTATLVDLVEPSSRKATQTEQIPLVNKYVPYASIDQALPYLIRRALENQSILRPDPGSGRGGAIGERKAIGREIRRRLGLTF